MGSGERTKSISYLSASAPKVTAVAIGKGFITLQFLRGSTVKEHYLSPCEAHTAHLIYKEIHKHNSP